MRLHTGRQSQPQQWKKLKTGKQFCCRNKTVVNEAPAYQNRSGDNITTTTIINGL